MWEVIVKILTSDKTPWIIVTITACISGWWALKKFRYEKRLEKFKETNSNLFKDKKQEVLAAIATLSIFKRSPEFEKNTIDVLLSRLYTELDYDIINSILTTLIQNSNKEELIYIAGGLQDINRNFFIQDYPMNQRMVDINNAIKSLTTTESVFNTPEYETLLADKKAEPEVFIRNKNEVEKKYNEEFKEIFSYQKYRSIWHKQVTADAYAMFMRKAFISNKKDGLEMNLYQNDFNYVYMAELGFEKVNAARSAFSFGTITDVHFNNCEIFRCTFESSKMNITTFRNGVLERVSFKLARLEEIVFENISFRDCSFELTDILKTKFINCTGLQQDHFIDAIYFDDECIFPQGIVVEHIESYKLRKQKEREELEKNRETNKDMPVV